MPSPEHEFLVGQLDATLQRFSKTCLYGVAEAERKKFDYGCLLERDLSRPLVAQVLWSHPEGIDKDLRTLLHDPEAKLKIYLTRSSTKHLMRIDEVVQSYRIDPQLSRKLVGLRTVPIPESFDADSEDQRNWIAQFLATKLRDDLLFGTIFGHLTASDFHNFADHGGPIGLKVAILDLISAQGLISNSEFKSVIGYGTSGPIREAIAMLNAAGLIRRLPRAVCCMPTVKGRLLMDLLRRLSYEWQYLHQWMPETVAVLSALKFENPAFPPSVTPQIALHDPIADLLLHCRLSKQSFGRDPLDGVDLTAPRFYRDFEYKLLMDRISLFPDANEAMFDEPESVFFPRSPSEA